MSVLGRQFDARSIGHNIMHVAGVLDRERKMEREGALNIHMFTKVLASVPILYEVLLTRVMDIT